MSWLRTPRALGAAAGAVAVLGLLWCGWTAWQVNRDLDEAVARGHAIQAAVEARDTASLDRELTALREASAAAADRTSGFTWSVLGRVPVLGDDARGIETTSRVLADLARDGVEPLVSASDRFEELLPRGGALDVGVAEELADPVARAHRAFAAADADLTAVDASGFVGRLHRQFTDFRDQVAEASDALGSAETATRVLPTMLGAEGPRRYLLVFENNAEIRGTGGLAGAVSYVEAADGRLELRGHVAASSLGEAPAPVLPLSGAEQELYGDVLGTYAMNATMTPDAPRAAALLKARWEREFPGQRVDGVVLLDALAIGYLLDATGPVNVDGVQITGANAVDELLHTTYLRLPEPARQDAFFAEVAAATFAKFTSGLGNPTGVLEALGRATDERRVLVHAFDDAVQQELAGTPIAGELATDPESEDAQVAVTLNDMTGAKMSYYLRYDVDVSATACRGSAQTYSAKARISSVAPPEAATLPDYITGGGTYGPQPGTQVLAVRVFGPVGGEVSDLEFNGVASEAVEVDQDGRPVAMTYVQLTPGQTVDLAWKMKSGAGQTGDTALAVTPTIERKDSTRTLPSACAGGR
ncbi:DUF4012 domain-containing protein [Nocardioides daeguensis]|uniref:DUF4012 domain-containing protein n=1 Tax=Nocardioides daeguensis TaxID=908359 RepID=A0ABP6V896_9ACTN|nr:DUF4012 domain-containing protein [Nocardioides daeguensis]MBV6726181.1 DUF4012 domain-containing protein [Nocardioides daeguensis]MCR1772024.1 DUF4012 domain-containing protein [Nocardioides daeguensis]